MAQIIVTGDSLTLSLTEMEKLASLHGDVTVPRSAISGARAVADGMSEVHGIRAPGTGLPGVIAAGTWRDRGSSTFAMCHGRHPAVVITLHGQGFDRLVVTTERPRDIVAALGR